MPWWRRGARCRGARGPRRGGRAVRRLTVVRRGRGGRRRLLCTRHSPIPTRWASESCFAECGSVRERREGLREGLTEAGPGGVGAWQRLRGLNIGGAVRVLVVGLTCGPVQGRVAGTVRVRVPCWLRGRVDERVSGTVRVRVSHLLRGRVNEKVSGTVRDMTRGVARAGLRVVVRDMACGRVHVAAHEGVSGRVRGAVRESVRAAVRGRSLGMVRTMTREIARAIIRVVVREMLRGRVPAAACG